MKSIILGIILSSILLTFIFGNDSVANAQNLTDNEVQEEVYDFDDDYNVRALPAVLILMGKLFGAAVVGYIVYKVGEMGSYAACKKYNDANNAWDLYCDAGGHFKD